MKARLILLVLILARPFTAAAADIVAYSGETITIAVAPRTGTLVEFPRPVSVVSSALNFDVNRIVTEVDDKGGGVNVRIVNVTAKGAAQSETIPFILVGGSSINVRFVVQAGADRHARLIFPQSKSGRILPGLFVELETALMQAMLRDEPRDGFTRSVHEQELVISGYDDLDLILVRRFSGKGLIGYTFKLVNTSDKRITINPQALNFDGPNRAILLQIDHETLDPCSVNRSVSPTSTGCMTAIRLVVRGDRFVMPASRSDLPFTTTKNER